MRLLLDTHVVIALCRKELAERYPVILAAVGSPDITTFASVVSLWEIAIKKGLDKLDARVPLPEIANVLESMDIGIFDINRLHAIGSVSPMPLTRDPFDRLLLVQCQVEGCQLVTVDRLLLDHPLAWRG